MNITKIKISDLFVLPIAVCLILSMGINGIQLIQANPETVIKFMHFYSRDIQTELPFYSNAIMWLTGFLMVAAVAVLFWATIKGEFLPDNKSMALKWGILIGIFSLTTYGFAVRMISNHQAAANLFFYVGLLYLLLWYVERHAKPNAGIFDNVKLLPIFLTLLYTMGQPGFQKIFNSSAVIPYYVQMFEGSILAKMPGGIPPFIYFLGVVEFSVPLILIISLAKGEFLRANPKPFFSVAVLIAIATFVMLNFGLSILTNYPGATNLVFYAIFTLWFYYYATMQK